MWDHPFGKTPILLLHVFALVLATSLSRFLVSQALELPPKSFDVTVSLLSLAFYIPAWIAVTSILFVAFGILVGVAVTIMTMVLGSVQMLSP